MKTPEKLILPNEFRSLKPSVYFIDELGSDTSSTYRAELRQILMQTLQAQQLEADENILNLEHWPEHSELSISLSHSLKVSCFGWCQKPSSLGVDIENIYRPNSKILKRVCTTEEVESAPYIPHLWTAKEAVFKSLRKKEIVLSTVEILDWRPKAKTEWFFTARWKDQDSYIAGIGFSCLRMDHSLSFFVHRP